MNGFLALGYSRNTMVWANTQNGQVDKISNSIRITKRLIVRTLVGVYRLS